MADKWPRDMWLEAIWEDPTLKPNERVVAYVYARYAFEGWTAWCSWAEVMRRTGIKSKDALSRALRGLVDAGWLEQVERPRQHRSAVYRLKSPVDNSPEVRETNLSVVRETNPWTGSGTPEVRDTAPEVRETNSEVRETGYQNSQENSQENSHLLRSQTRASGTPPPDGQRPAAKPNCARCAGKRWISLGAGCMDRCPDCSPEQTAA